MTPDRADYITLRKPLSCRLGMHQWYGDGAMLYSADKCSRCGKWRSDLDGSQVDLERAAWAQVPKDMPLIEQIGWVREAMLGLHIDGSSEVSQ